MCCTCCSPNLPQHPPPCPPWSDTPHLQPHGAHLPLDAPGFRAAPPTPRHHGEQVLHSWSAPVALPPPAVSSELQLEKGAVPVAGSQGTGSRASGSLAGPLAGAWDQDHPVPQAHLPSSTCPTPEGQQAPRCGARTGRQTSERRRKQLFLGPEESAPLPLASLYSLQRTRNCTICLKGELRVPWRGV